MAGLGDLEKNVAKLEEANEQMRALIRESHETIKSAKLTLKELKEEHARWSEGIKTVVDEALGRQIKMGLDEFKESLRTAITEAHQNVIDEFEKLTNIMMYGNDKGKGANVVETWLDAKIRAIVRDEWQKAAKAR